MSVQSFKKNYKFQVEKILKYPKDKLMEFNPPVVGRTLKLITCIENNQKRLVISLKEIDL